MGKGQSARSGRAPDPEALRRDRKDDAAGWITLPIEGRKGRTPSWPLSHDMDATKQDLEFAEIELSVLEEQDEDDQDVLEVIGVKRKVAGIKKIVRRLEREHIYWKREWKRPQAIMWERNGQHEEIAMYCRALAEAEELGATTASRTLVRQLQEAIGISIPGLQRNRWKIGDVTDESAPTHGRPSAPSAARGRPNMRVIPGGKGAKKKR